MNEIFEWISIWTARNGRGRTWFRVLGLVSLVMVFGLNTGCHTSYLVKQGAILRYDLSRRTEIRDVLKSEEYPYELKKDLIEIRRIRSFAGERMGMNVGDSYSDYLELPGKHPGWVLTATEPFSMEPVRWRFMPGFSFPYIGFFSRTEARLRQSDFIARGYDTQLRPMTAFSGLGWLNEPVYSSFLDLSRPALIETILHELAHRTFFYGQNVELSEAAASVVGKVGMRAYLDDRAKEENKQNENAENRSKKLERYIHKSRAEQKRIRSFFRTLRKDLEDLYNRDRNEEFKRRRKARKIRAAKLRFLTKMKDLETIRIDSYLQSRWNNAFLRSQATYNQYIPEVRSLWKDYQPDLKKMIQFLTEIQSASSPLEHIRRKIKDKK